MKYLNLLVFVLLIQPCFVEINSQEVEKLSPRMDFTYLKRSDGSKLLKVVLDRYKSKVSYPIYNSNVVFTLGENNDSVVIKTDAEGIAQFVIDKNYKLPRNKEGNFVLSANFAGNDTLTSENQELTIKDAYIDLKLELVDTVRTIYVKLTSIDEKGDTIPVVGENINIYVPRMINPLKIGEGTTDDNGEVSVEFPLDLPGNKDSTIIVIAKLEESDVYANIESKKSVNWGIPIINRIHASYGELWTEIAPTWMIITLTIMLLGVWGHYIFVILQLIKVNKETRKLKAQNLDNK